MSPKINWHRFLPLLSELFARSPLQVSCGKSRKKNIEMYRDKTMQFNQVLSNGVRGNTEERTEIDNIQSTPKRFTYPLHFSNFFVATVIGVGFLYIASAVVERAPLDSFGAFFFTFTLFDAFFTDALKTMDRSV